MEEERHPALLRVPLPPCGDGEGRCVPFCARAALLPAGAGPRPRPSLPPAGRPGPGPCVTAPGSSVPFSSGRFSIYGRCPGMAATAARVPAEGLAQPQEALPGRAASHAEPGPAWRGGRRGAPGFPCCLPRSAAGAPTEQKKMTAGGACRPSLSYMLICLSAHVPVFWGEGGRVQRIANRVVCCSLTGRPGQGGAGDSRHSKVGPHLACSLLSASGSVRGHRWQAQLPRAGRRARRPAGALVTTHDLQGGAPVTGLPGCPASAHLAEHPQGRCGCGRSPWTARLTPALAPGCSPLSAGAVVMPDRASSWWPLVCELLSMAAFAELGGFLDSVSGEQD